MTRNFTVPRSTLSFGIEALPALIRCSPRFLCAVTRMAREDVVLLVTVLILVSGAAAPSRVWANTTGCFKITVPTSATTSAYYTDPGAVTSNWAGSIGTAGVGAYPMTVSVNAPPFVPDGTLLGSAISPLYNLGANGVGGYNPETILFRCSPDSSGTMYEYFATNGDNPWAGETDMSGQSGIPGSYETYYTGVVSRVTNLTTGQYVSRYWQARALTGLDTDSQGWYLVKAKNFSQYKLEFFQCSTCQSDNYGAGSTNSGLWLVTEPVAYVAFVGGASGNIIKGNLAVGADSLTNYDGWYGNWPGAINAYQTVYLRWAATCAVTNATPVVNFIPITVSELNRGGARQVPITIQMQCQTVAPSGSATFASGTGANKTALGILAAPANAQNAINAGLKTPGSGVSYLLSDGYGTDPGVPSGVGVALSRPNGTPLNFLTNEYVTTGGTNDGWDPVLNDASVAGSPGNGLTSYTRTINATFKAFAPGVVPVTAGSFNATAQIIVRVQ